MRLTATGRFFFIIRAIFTIISHTRIVSSKILFASAAKTSTFLGSAFDFDIKDRNKVRKRDRIRLTAHRCRRYTWVSAVLNELAVSSAIPPAAVLDVSPSQTTPSIFPSYHTYLAGTFYLKLVGPKPLFFSPPGCQHYGK